MKRYATSLAELSAIFEKNVVTLQKYGHQGCPCRAKDKDDRGRYNVAAIRRWMKEHGYLEKRPPNPNGRGPQQGEFAFDGTDTAKLRKWQAEERKHKAELAELELKARRGELVSVEEVRELNRKTLAFLANALENWARALGPALSGKSAVEINRIMRRKVQELLSEFASRRNTA